LSFVTRVMQFVQRVPAGAEVRATGVEPFT